MRRLIVIFAFAFLLVAPSYGASKKPTNKLLYMYNLYYLPFSIDFRQGSSVNEILPLTGQVPKGKTKRLLTANEMQSINRLWDGVKDDWRKRSLFLKTPVKVNERAVISQRLISHKIPIGRRAFDGIPLNQRIQLLQAIKNRPPEVQSSFKQLRFLKGFLPNTLAQEKFNFFVFSASWCESCREYRVLFESYFKQFPNKKVILHSIVLDDPREEIFDSSAIKELFPNQKRYSHESIPRFLAMEFVKGQPVVYEEGDALKVVYERFLKKYRGFLDNKTKLFKGAPRKLASPATTR